MLKFLTEDEFARRVETGARTPVFREFLADRETPVSVLTRVSNEESVFLLESVTGGETCGRYSFLGLDPYATYSEHGKYNPMTELRPQVLGRPFTPAPELPPLQGGAIGYLAYDAVRTFVPRVGLTREEGTPTAEFLLTDTILVFDHVRQTIIISYVTGPTMRETVHAAYMRACRRIQDVYDSLLTADSITQYIARRGERREHHVGPFVPEMTQTEFTDMVEACKKAIAAGEVIQIVPSQKFTAETDLPALSLYRALRLVNPSPYNFFLKLGEKTLIGSSPEELVKLQDGLASTCPIAGTRPRGATPAEDRALEQDLVNDPKERAEHVMLVDLGRNDLGRVSKIGTVRVEDFAHVERYSHVMHLVSNVFGELAEGRDAFDLLEAAFPAGTLSGAPKVRAMELIAQFEKSPRGIYGGAVGYFSYTGDMNFAIVIRTMLLEKGWLVMRAGAGIVADSDPIKEYQETLNKSKAIFVAAQFATTL
ncbi:MAG: anthranilate synthase component I family protein [Kiritimatiellia bacterium]